MSDDRFSNSHGAEKLERHFQKNHICISLHKDAILKLYHAFNEYINKESIDLWCQELKDFDKKVVEDAVREIYMNNTKFPKLPELRAKCRDLAPEVKRQEKQKEDVRKIKSEHEKFTALKESYFKACEQKGIDPKQSLEKLVKRWLKARNMSESMGFGMTVSMFERCALFDLDKSKKENLDFETVAAGQ